MSIKILHNPRCSKSRQTLAIITDNGQSPEVIDYLNGAINKKELDQIVQQLGIKPEELVRKGEKIYKEEFKGKTLTDEEWLEAMIANPKLIERPIVIKNGRAIIGRPPENVLSLLD